jgi:protein TonB
MIGGFMPGNGPRSHTGAVVASGWLAEGVYDHPRRKIGRALAASLTLHAGFAASLIVALTIAPGSVLEPPITRPDANLIFLRQEGPGGGGGGSPSPAPPKRLEVPQHQPAAVVPIPVPEPPQPLPALDAPIQTNTSALLQASGTSVISLADWGGGGKGRGIGSGTGDGVGPGEERGWGGGAPAPGNGITWPVEIIRVQPKYTTGAMREKIQGKVILEVVIREDGTVGDVRVIKSLDPSLDAAAIAAARQWKFKPAMRDGKPVAVRVQMELEFRLH